MIKLNSSRTANKTSFQPESGFQKFRTNEQYEQWKHDSKRCLAVRYVFVTLPILSRMRLRNCRRHLPELSFTFAIFLAVKLKRVSQRAPNDRVFYLRCSCWRDQFHSISEQSAGFFSIYNLKNKFQTCYNGQ